MTLSNILEALQEERNRIDAAIEALSGKRVNNERRESNPSKLTTPKRQISTAERERRSKAQRARWDKIKEKRGE